jgi:four helix bundle protein
VFEITQDGILLLYTNLLRVSKSPIRGRLLYLNIFFQGVTMGSAKTFEDLLVWQKAHLFVLAVCRISASFPKHEIFGLTSQFRRAAVSIAANIAEGFRKHSNADKIRYYNIARGSLEECRYYLILTRDLEYSDVSKENLLLQEVSKLLEAYSRGVLNSES